MKLSLVLISSYKSWQGNKDICTLLYFYKRFAWKKNLRHVISSFFFPPLLNALSQRQPSTLSLRVERKVVWQEITLCVFCADRGMFWGACTSRFHSDRPHSVFTVSRTDNSSAGEALAERCGSTMITAGSGPCHITQQYKFDLDQVWAHDYTFVKLAECFVRILCHLSAFILLAEEEHTVPEPQRVRAVWATNACCSSHPIGAKLTCQSFVWTNWIGKESSSRSSMLCHAPVACKAGSGSVKNIQYAVTHCPVL